MSDNPIENTLAILAILYFVPTAIAAMRWHNVGSVLVINLFLGWSLIGWVVALAWALSSKPRITVVTTAQASAPIRQASDDHLRQSCPFCSERILQSAKVCRFCGRDIPIPEPVAIPPDLTAAQTTTTAHSLFGKMPKFSKIPWWQYATGGGLVILVLGILVMGIMSQPKPVAENAPITQVPQDEKRFGNWVTERGDEYGYIAANKSWPSDAKVLYVNYLGNEKGVYYMTFTTDDGHAVTESCYRPCKQADETQALNGKIDVRRKVHFSQGTPLNRAIQDMMAGYLAPSKYPNN